MDEPDRNDGSALAADLELVRRLRAGDETAFEAFFDERFQPLYRFALARVDRDAELAREIAQATFCKAFEKLATFRGEASLFTWLCAICRSEVSAHYRRLDRRPREVALDGEDDAGLERTHASPLDGPETAALRHEVSRHVHSALDRLPPHYGQVLEWKYALGLSVQEIAGRLGATPKATESLLTRARDAFRSDYLALGGALPAAFSAARG